LLVQAKHVVLPAKLRLALVLGGCVVATIGYFLPWYRISSQVFTGAAIDGDPPYYITVFSIGQYRYALLFTLIAVALVSVFSYFRNRESVLVQVFGRALQAGQVVFLLLSVWVVGVKSISGPSTLFFGFWLVVAAMIAIFVGQWWPYFDRLKPDVGQAALLSFVFLGLALVEAKVGKQQLELGLFHALGGGNAAALIAYFAADLLGIGLVAAIIGAVRAWYLANRDEL
jgi:hypothetical protein